MALRPADMPGVLEPRSARIVAAPAPLAARPAPPISAAPPLAAPRAAPAIRKPSAKLTAEGCRKAGPPANPDAIAGICVISSAPIAQRATKGATVPTDTACPLAAALSEDI